MQILKWGSVCALAMTFHHGSSAQSLEAAVEMAQRTNPQLAVQRQVILQAEERLVQAKAQARPSLVASGSYGFESVDTNRPFGVVTGERAVSQAQIEAQLPIYTGGQIKAGIRQAEAGLSVDQAAKDSVLQTLILDTVTAYMDVLQARKAVALRQSSVKLLSEQLRATQDRFEVGVVTRTDVALTEARLAGTRAALSAAKANLEAAIAAFTVQTGQAPADLQETIVPPALPGSLETALQQALLSNPDLIQARQAEQVARAARRLAEASLKPSVVLVGTAEAQQTYDNNYRDTSLSAVARARIPLYQGGILRSKVRSAQLQIDQSKFNVDLLTRQIEAQLSQAWYGHHAALQSIKASRQQVEAAEIAFAGAQEELAVGVRTTLDVLDQEQDLLEARLALAEARRDAVVSAYQLLRITGQINFP